MTEEKKECKYQYEIDGYFGCTKKQDDEYLYSEKCGSCFTINTCPILIKENKE
jgi:hypothetical protein